MLKWLFSKHFKAELNSHFNRLHLDLSKAFLNIKNDISNIHNHLGEKSSKLYELERRLIAIEQRMILSLEEGRKLPQIEEKENDEEKIESEASEFPTLTFTQKIILAAIYELEKQHNSPISFKSLATFLYPGKNYASVRTTLSDYIDLLSTYKLVKKEKIKRETLAITTKKGQRLANEIVQQRKQKSKKLINLS